MEIFYVYRHVRNDTGVVFYVGKGKEKRAYQTNKGRNNHWRNVVNKAGGFSVDFIIDGVDEEFSHLVEIEAIDAYRRRCVSLTNITDGGDGVSGLLHSEETRAIIRAKRKLQKISHSPDTIEKIAAAQRGRLKGPNPEHSIRLMGRKLTDEHKAKIAASHTGMKRSDEARAAMSEAQRGRTVGDEARANMAAAQRGKKQSAEWIENRISPLRGRKRDPEIAEKCSATQKGRPKNPESVAKMRATMNSPEVRAKISGENHWRAKRRVLNANS
jgi:hypothetical protein